MHYLLLFLTFIGLSAENISIPDKNKTFNETEQLMEVVKQFHLRIADLDEEQFMRLFLHDSVTWAMIREGDTYLKSKKNNPKFTFFSSHPSAFMQFLKKKGGAFEERFYNLSISCNESFATIEFLYSFHADEELLNWGKEYWSLMKVEREWKITAVGWTENLQHIEKCPFCEMEYLKF